MRTGHIVQVVGPVVDVLFPLDNEQPDINNALLVDKKKLDGTTETITLEEIGRAHV